MSTTFSIVEQMLAKNRLVANYLAAVILHLSLKLFTVHLPITLTVCL